MGLARSDAGRDLVEEISLQRGEGAGRRRVSRKPFKLGPSCRTAMQRQHLRPSMLRCTRKGPFRLLSYDFRAGLRAGPFLCSSDGIRWPYPKPDYGEG